MLLTLFVLLCHFILGLLDHQIDLSLNVFFPAVLERAGVDEKSEKE